MCGIAGFWGQGNIKDIRSMINKLDHRGPDDNNIFSENNSRCVFGHARLTIIDEKGGKQPMISDNGRYVLTYNGEIYNAGFLRKTLEKKKIKFSSKNSDTELVLRAFEYWQESCFVKFNGMFAIGIWDKKEKRIIIARDRFGEKPLFYYFKNQNFIFSSELSSLSEHSFVEKKISTLSLKKYFVFNHIPSPHTLFENCYKCQAGEYIIFNVGKKSLDKKKYYHFKIQEDETFYCRKEHDILDELDDLLTKAVSSRFLADVPVGAFLSGGIDSSLVCSILKKIEPENFAGSLSIGVDQESYDESVYAKKVAKHLKMKNKLIVMQSKDWQKELIFCLKRLDEPMGDYSFVPSYYLCKEARKISKVMISGHGSDEIFCGYTTFEFLKLINYVKFSPYFLRKKIARLVDFLPIQSNYMNLFYKVNKVAKGLQFRQEIWNPVWLSSLQSDEISDLFEEKTDINELYDDAIDLWSQSSGKNINARTQEYYTKFYLQDYVLTKMDRASMLHSLEVRTPYLDNDVTNFANRLPMKFKVRNGNGKYILKQLAKRYLPKNIINRPKHGFAVPINDWIKTIEKPNDLSDNYPINKKILSQMIDSHYSGKKDYRLFAWNVLVLKNYKLK